MNPLVVLDNLSQIRSRIAAAADRAGRNPDAVTIVAVTKYAPLEPVKELLESGRLADFAENRVQDAARKSEALNFKAHGARLRMIGHLQTNKVKKALQVFDAIDSLDSLALAAALQRELESAGRELFVLAQVKLTDRESQSGLEPSRLGGFLRELEAYPRLKVAGLMAIAPNVEPVEEVRPHFKRMKRLFDEFFAGREHAQLSMGMSRDFEIAVEEGATHVRVGTSIFSQ